MAGPEIGRRRRGRHGGRLARGAQRPWARHSCGRRGGGGEGRQPREQRPQLRFDGSRLEQGEDGAERVQGVGAEGVPVEAAEPAHGPLVVAPRRRRVHVAVRPGDLGNKVVAVLVRDARDDDQVADVDVVGKVCPPWLTKMRSRGWVARALSAASFAQRSPCASPGRSASAALHRLPGDRRASGSYPSAPTIWVGGGWSAVVGGVTAQSTPPIVPSRHAG